MRKYPQIWFKDYPLNRLMFLLLSKNPQMRIGAWAESNEDNQSIKKVNNMSDLRIREVRLEDAARLVEIYSYYVLNTAVSFEYEVPTVEEFEQRIKKITVKFPYLVCEKDGKIVGYVYAGEYSARSAYSWTAAMSIYVDKDFRRQGIGSAMYKEIEPKLKKMGIVNLLAGTEGQFHFYKSPLEIQLQGNKGIAFFLYFAQQPVNFPAVH